MPGVTHVLLFAAAIAASPVPGFRPPASPILSQSPLINVFSACDSLNSCDVTHWTGKSADWFSGVRVDGVFYLLLGNPTQDWNSGALPLATQTSLAVFATQTKYTFTAGPVTLNLTFTSPQIATDFDLMSRPAHYVTFSAASTDGAVHHVQIYFDVTPRLVITDESTSVSFSRVSVAGGAEALSFGNAAQAPLSSTNDRANWGVMYVLRDTGVPSGGALALSNATRSMFVASGGLPPDSPVSPVPFAGGAGAATGVQKGKDRSGSDMPGSPFDVPSADPNLCWAACNTTAGCKAWAFADPACDSGFKKPTCWLKGDFPPVTNAMCRWSGYQEGWPTGTGSVLAGAVTYDLPAVGVAPVARTVVVAVDEILGISWFGELMPPWWRRALPVNSTAAVPSAMLADAWASATATRELCDAFDASTAALLSSVGGDEYATVAQLTYRQVFAGQMLVFSPTRNTVWYFLKEISSCGCLQTADVIYPAFPQVLFYNPELAKLWMITHLEYASGMTPQPYPLAWAPHHLGYWPLADLPYTGQENMPLEETAWDLLIIAAIAQRQGGDVAWLAPYWSTIEKWYSFLITLLPFPQEQLSTDDFDGPLYNATNLAVKGVASIAAYGYIAELFTGNASVAAAAYATAVSYSQTMVQYSWLANGTQSHFMIGYKGSKQDGGDPRSWPMLYNALWLRLLGFEDLVPAALLTTQRDWYAANVMQEYGLPLNSRKLYTKDDWATFMAATFFDDASPPAPSAFSNALFRGLFRFANETTSREPLSDWTNTDSPTAVGFSNRPVYGAMYAPVLVTRGKELGLGRAGNPGDASLARAAGIFRAAWDAAPTPT